MSKKVTQYTGHSSLPSIIMMDNFFEMNEIMDLWTEGNTVGGIYPTPSAHLHHLLYVFV